MSAALWVAVDEEHWSATELSRGPWHPDFCHGGPVATLLARAVETFDDGPWIPAQHHVELTRPVPVGRPLRLDTRLDRPGRKVSVIATTVSDGDVVVARSRAVRIRLTDLALPAGLAPTSPPVAPPTESSPSRVESSAVTDVAFHSHSVEFRAAEGDVAEPGPVTAWIRLTVPVVAGEEPTGIQRLTSVADFPNGISNALDPARFSFINPDVSINVVRPPRGEWIALRASTSYGDPTASTGVAFAEAELFDVDGRVGHTTQSLLLEPRD